MATEALVDSRVEAGEQLIKQLDKRNFGIVAAFWLFYPEVDRWRLVIAPKVEMQHVIESYLAVVRAMRELKIPPEVLASDDVNLIQPYDPLLRGIAMFRIEGLSRVRLKSNWLNGVYLEDALVYRNAA